MLASGSQPAVGRHWPVFLVLSVCVLVLAGMRLRTFDEPLELDLTTYAVIGHELLHDRSLYADLWDHKPPAIHVVYAAADLLVGYGPQQIYLLNLTAAVVTLFGLFRAGTLLTSQAGGLCAALLWAIGSTFRDWLANQPNTEAFINAALIWAYCAFLSLNASPSWKGACAFGAAVAVASLFKQIVVAPAGLIGIVYVLGAGGSPGGRGRAVRHMLLASVVSSLPWAGCAAWFWGRGHYSDYHDAVFTYNRLYAGSMLANLQANLVPARLGLLALALAPCLVVLGFAGPALGPVRRKGWVGLAAWAVGSFIAIALPGHLWAHYLQLWLPIYALAGGALVAVLLTRRGRSGWAVLAAMLVPLVTRQALDLRLDGDAWSWSKYGNNQYCDSRDTGRAIAALVPPDESFYLLGNKTGLYFYSGRSPASGVFYDFPLARGSPLSARLEARILDDLERRPPELIVVEPGYLAPLGGQPAQNAQRLVSWVSQHYVACGSFSPRFTRYARRGSDLARRLAEES